METTWLVQQVDKRGMKWIWNDIRILVGALIGNCFIGRHASRLVISYCRSSQKTEDEYYIENLPCDCKALCHKLIATIDQGFLDDISEVVHIKPF